MDMDKNSSRELTKSPAPPAYSEATMSSCTADYLGGVSPLTTAASTPIEQTSVLPVAGTPTLLRSTELSEINSVESSQLQHLPIESKKSECRIDYECYPEAVVAEAPVARLEVAHSPSEPGLEVVAHSSPEVRNQGDDAYTSSLEVMAVNQTPPKVTPLHLLGDQPDWIDCPHCLQCTRTQVRTKPSNATHLQAVALLFTTVCGAAAPYIAKWSFDVEQFCQSCNGKVASRPQGRDIQICKVPTEWKETSKYSTVNPETV